MSPTRRPSGALGAVVVAAVASTLALTAIVAAVPASARGSAGAAGARAATTTTSPRTTGPGTTSTVPAATGVSIDVTAVSPWVAPDGDFRVDMRIVGPVPPDAVLRTSIHQRVTTTGDESLHDAVADVIDGNDLPGLLQAPISRPLAELGDPALGVVLDLPVRSSRSQSADRVLLPTAGVHPIEVQVTTADGAVLAERTVFLNRLPTDMPTAADGTAGRLSVSMYMPVDGPAAIAPDGAAAIDDETRGRISQAAAALAAVPSAPITLAIRPNLLTGLSRSSDPTDRDSLERLRTLFGSAGSNGTPASAGSVARMTYAAVDSGGLAAATGGLGELLRQVALGDTAVHDVLGTEPATATWFDDDTVTDQAISLLGNLGVRRLAIGANRLRVTERGVPEDAPLRSAVSVSGTGLTATSPDEDLTAELTDPAASSGVRANEVTTALMSVWFGAAERTGAFPGPSQVLAVPTDVDPATLQALLPAFDPSGPLAADAASVPTAAARYGSRTATAALAARDSPDQTAAIDGLTRTRAQIDGFRSLAPSATLEPAEWELIDAQTLDRSMSTEERARYHSGIAAQIEELTKQIHMPPERRVVLTARDQAIPLRFRNDLPYDVELVLWTRSVRLDVQGGDRRQVVLHPGENRIDLPVSARAPGDTILRVAATSPDGALRLPTTAMPVGVSSISGVGAALSIASLLFLAGWWIVTVRRDRRRRRDRGDGTGDGAGGPDDVPPPDPEATGSATAGPGTGVGRSEPAEVARTGAGTTGTVDAGG